MNLLLFNPEELRSDGTLLIHGQKGEHLRDVLRVRPGDGVRVGEINGRTGSARVLSTDESVVLQIESLGPDEATEPGIDLILALPRPQTLKKVLSTAATIGVGRILLINSDRVEPSYFSSPVLKPERISAELLLGLEQGRSTRMPKVDLLADFGPGRKQNIRDDSAQVEALCGSAGHRLLPDPEAPHTFADLLPSFSGNTGGRCLIAIGPEGGWRDREREHFRVLGFTACSFGPRILRVETALPYAVAQISILRELAGRSSNASPA